MGDHPLALVCYNRPAHLERVLAALRRLHPDPLYVFCDGPKNEADARRVLDVRELLETIDWTPVELVARPRNVGLAASVTGAADHVLVRHETVVVLEDDCVPGPYFCEFMHACLERYQDVDEVMAVGGYTLPLPDTFLENYPYDAYFHPRIESWGWATWRRAWDKYERDTAKAVVLCRERGIDVRQGGADVPRMANERVEGHLDAWTPGWLLSVYLHGGCCVYPTRSHVENIGMDGSGVHCGQTAAWETPLAERGPERFPDAVEFRPEIDRIYRGRFG